MKKATRLPRFLVVSILLALHLTIPQAMAAPFTVTGTADGTDVSPGNGLCDDGTGQCTLRAAIQEANALAGSDTITLPAGTYTLTLTGQGEDFAATGDLDISFDVTILGGGARTTIIQAGTSPGTGLDRVIHVLGGTTTIRDATIRYGADPGVDPNSSNRGGAGIRIEGGAVVLDKVIVSSNVASGSFGRGGGVRVESGSLTVTNSTFSGNSTSDLGGGIFNRFGNINLTNTTISGNYAGTAGGGIMSGASNADVMRLQNVTITGNTAGSHAGGIRQDFDTFRPVNTIIAGNSAGFSANCLLQSVSVDNRGHNLGPTECGFSAAQADQVTTNPGLGSLSDNGGPTDTLPPQTGSLAIDHGNPGTPGSGGDTCAAADQRGVTRPQDGDSNGSLVCDVGAFELENSSVCGDGVLGLGETCDDTNTTSGDGCSATCQTEICFTCVGAPSVCTPSSCHIFTVDSAADVADANPGDNECDDGAGHCTLRAAIQETNALSGDDAIFLPQGTYTRTLGPADPANSPGNNPAASGDLDITDSLTITGDGAATTIVDADGIDRVFHVLGGTVRISGISMQGGNPTGGCVVDTVAFACPAGGGLCVKGGSVTVTNSRITGNAGCQGAGAEVGTSLSLDGVTVDDNIGRGLQTAGGTVTLLNSTVSGNDEFGIFNNGGTTLVNSTVSGNGSTGIYTFAGAVDLNNVTITNNPEGLRANDSGSPFNMKNTILAGNTYDCFPFGYGTPTINSQGFNLIENAVGCSIVGDTTGNLTGVSPILGPLQDNGGATQTHALSPCSPAIDTGNPLAPGSDASACPAADQRGETRPQDGDGNSEFRCDVGAFEAPTRLPSVCGDGVVGPCEGCDDGNTSGGDGCSSACEVETCFTCEGEPSVCTPSTGTLCDDGLFCTGTDACDAGICVHAGNPCPGADGDENCGESCDEAADSCTAADPDGSPCDDGLFCTGTETCNSGSCSTHTGDPCPGTDGDENCTESCNEDADDCSAADPNGSACDDGLFCTGTDSCSSGSCSTHTGDPCPGTDGDGNCAESCNETVDNCSAPDPNGSACDDGLFCTGTDTCSSGTCSAHTGDPCPGPDGDGNCAESCNETADNCTAADPNGSACTDGLFCTGADTCNAGACSAHTGNPCPGADGDGNCAESCNETADNCTAADPNGSACTDGLFCTGTDTCNAGACSVHTGSPCPGADGDGNCAESCDETADNCTAADPNGSACTDGLFCTGADTCNAGVCSAHTGNPCPGADGDGNCAESCNEAADTCTAADPNGSSCEDGNPCTTGDTCQSGSCTSGAQNGCETPTPPGSNVAVEATFGSNVVSTTFGSVLTGGNTTITSIDPSTAGTLPGGFALTGSSLAFEISTTASFSGPILACFEVPSITNPVAFSNLRIIHGVSRPDLAVANASSNNVSIRLGNGSGSFGSASSLSVGTTPSGVAAGDFNGDGRPDLAVVNQGSNNVSIRLGDGAGGFGGVTNFAVGSSPRSVAVADFNGDGKRDLAVANGSSNNVSILLGNSSGGFGAAVNFSAGTTPNSVAVGDFDLDGSADLAVANQGSNNVSIRLGNGSGGFGGVTNFSVGTSPRSITIADFNRDGHPDMAVANASSNSVSIRLGNGTGGFGGATSLSVGTSPRSVAVGDLNRDGNPDMVVANNGSNNLSVRLGNGTGGFGSATSFSVGSRPSAVAVADFNADGSLDVAVANNGSNNVSIRLGNGAGSLGSATTFSMGTAPAWIVADNFNRDTVLVDQTILSGPNAPNFATKTICASAQSLSPFVLATTIQPQVVLERRVSTGSDDAEQRGNSIDLSSSDLELIKDGSTTQVVGIRFTNITVPRGRTIQRAWIQFQVDETQAETTNLTLQVQAIDNAPTFSSSNNVTSRTRTGAVAWGPVPAWTTEGQAGADQKTPDIATLIQAVVNRSGWSSGNALAIIISGTGHRTAVAFDGTRSGAPLLHIEY